MHGRGLDYVLLVNAEVDSMGGVIDGGVGIDTKASPRRAAIEKAQAELRQEYDVREERRRELEFLEKGGNPLDFKFGSGASISFQSTSLTDQFVTSEAKGSFALTASPHGDSVESSGRPGVPLGRETNTADNLLLFDAENDVLEGERSFIRPNRSNIAPSEQSSQLDDIHNTKESEDLAIFPFVVKSQAYARRNRSRKSRDSARACSTELGPTPGGNGSSGLPSSRHGSRSMKGFCETAIKKDHSVSSICKSKFTSTNGDVVTTATSENHMDMELDDPQVHGTDNALSKSVVVEVESDVAGARDSQSIDHDQQPPVNANQFPSSSPDLIGERGVSSGVEHMPCAATMEGPGSVGEAQGFSIPNIDDKDVLNVALVSSKKDLDLESSCSPTNLRLDGDTSDQCLKNNNSYENSKKSTVTKETPDTSVLNVVEENRDSKDVEALVITSGESGDPTSLHQKRIISDSCVKSEEEILENNFSVKNETEVLANNEGMECNDHSSSKADRMLDNQLVDESNTERTVLCPQVRPTNTTASSQCEFPEAAFSGKGSETAPALNTCTGSQIKLASKVVEDSVLEEARIIEAKRKRIAELSVVSFPLENRRKSHWDFVLEEMAWLANDFMQESLWKRTAAAQICHLVASSGRSRFDKQNLLRMQRKVAHTLAKAITEFWHSAEVLLSSNDPSIDVKDTKLASVGSQKLDGGAAIENRISEPNMETIKALEEQRHGKVHQLAVREYAIRFLKYCNSSGHPDQAEAPRTPDRISDLGMMEWEHQSSEETLFYRVPLDAMEGYRKSVELHWSQYEKSVRNMQHEEVETFIYDTDADFGFQENAYEEYDGETGIHYLPGAFEGSKSSKLAQKKRKNPSKSYNARSYEVGADLPYGHSMDNKMGTHSSFLLGKRPSNSINVGSIPTKRVRTAARQRLVSPFSAGATGGVQLPNKTDASSGDTSSFQDDQSTVLGGSQIRKGLELESTGEFGKQLQSDSADISMKPKKKKPKHMVYKNSFNSTNSGGYGIGKGSAYEQRWQLDSMVQNEQRDHSKKRSDIHGFESNGNGVASQVINLSNPSKLIKLIAGRDRGRKGKALKVSSGQSGLNSPSWSQFEDQALVVLVHDMGPNFELVSDVFNSTLQFKCIFRKPNDCKERHRLLMDKDGADSADDSGSSQPYPATLPGIPQGSARQLFQRLQGPMEEDTLKSHFEKIIFIGRQQHSRKSQNDNQDLKQIAPVHNSHVHALSTVCPNNLNGVPLTPLDICDATSSSTDVIPLGYQGSHTSGLAISNQGSVAPVLPTSGSSSMLQGSSGMAIGNSLPSPSAPLNVSRDGHRYGGTRPPSLPIDEQQRMQQYNQMLSGRNIQHSGLSVPGSLPGTDRGVRLLPGANGMGMMCGMSRGMPMPRPGFQGIGSQSMLNMASPGNMLSCAAVGMPNSVNQGTSMMRSRGDALHMMRPGQNPEDQRQMMQELQLQATQGNSQGIPPPFSGMCTNQTPPPSGQTFPIQHQQQQHQIPLQQSHLLNTTPQHPPNLQGNNHAAATPQQQAYMIRLAKERQLQHRFYHQQQQQQQFGASNISPMPHGQPQSQHHPISSSCLPNNSQIHQQQVSPLPSSNSQLPLTSSSPMNPVSSQPQPKQHHLPLHGLGRNNHQGGSAGGLPTQMMKQRQRQHQLQQTGRQLPQPRQTSQQQPAKHIKGMGRGNTTTTHQNLPSVDPGHVNGLSTTNPGNQVHEKGDQQAIHLMQQGQGLLSGSNSVQPGKSLAVPPTQPSTSQPHQKLFSRSPPSLSKQVPQKMSSHPDHCNQGQPSPSVSSGHTPLASQQPVPPSTMPMAPSQQQPQAQTQLQPRQAGHSQQQSAQRMLNQNHRQMNNSDMHMQSSVDQTQHVNSSTFQMPQQGCSAESTSVIPVVSSSSTGTAQWNASEESLYDSNVPNSANHLSASLGNNSPLPSTAEIESAASPSQDVTSHLQFPGSATPVHGNNVGAQWQPQPPQQQPPPSSPQKQSLPPEQQQQPPQQHSQAGQTGVYARPSNSGPGPGPGPGPG